MAEKQ
jgi:hypothetical protein